MTQGSYKQFCPVAMAAEVLCPRWTIIILRELVAGSTRFNDLRRGVPRMSPALLSRRLKELESAGVVQRVKVKGASGVYDYQLTPAGEELAPIVEAFGHWGQRWVESELSLQHLDAQLLMWDMRRQLDPSPMPRRKSVIQFIYAEQAPSWRNFWLIVEPKEPVDLCSVDPGFDVDLYVNADLRTMTAIWIGVESLASAQRAKRVNLVGDAQLAKHMHSWLGLSPFATTKAAS